MGNSGAEAPRPQVSRSDYISYWIYAIAGTVVWVLGTRINEVPYRIGWVFLSMGGLLGVGLILFRLTVVGGQVHVWLRGSAARGATAITIGVVLVIVVQWGTDVSVTGSWYSVFLGFGCSQLLGIAVYLWRHNLPSISTNV